MTDSKIVFRAAKHWVIKIGSGVIVRDTRHIDRPTFSSLVQGVHHLLAHGHRVTVVSSGAVAMGRRTLGMDGPCDVPELQALAAVGQAQLIRMWDEEFRHYGHRAAQVLFGRADFDRRASFLNARLALDAIHRMGVVPVINENDTTATEGLRFDDNDQLAGITAGLVQADVLVILSDIEGIYDLQTANGARAFGPRLRQLSIDDPKLDQVAGPSTSGVGRGGMISKVGAARTAGRAGVPTIIAPGKRHGVLEAIWSGEDIGTQILPSEAAVQGRKVWLGAGAMTVGAIHCDAGAKRAITKTGASLLPKGIVRVVGDFPEGAVVDVVGPDGEVFARGLSVYGAAAVRQLAGRHSDDIEAILGYRVLDAIVHRDSLVLV